MSKSELVGDIRDLVASLDAQARKILDSERARPGEPGIVREMFLSGQALRLADYYSSCERIFERVATELNARPAESPDYDRILLRRMTLDVPGVRPPVLSKRSHSGLDELRKFRHAMRHLYGTEIDEAKLGVHLEALKDLYAPVTADLERFCSALERVLREGGATAE